MGLPEGSVSTGGFCRARKRLPLDMVSTLVQASGKLIAENVPESWLWKGRRVLLVDGTTALMPDTPDNQAVYPQQSTQKAGLGFPICRILGVICLSSGAVLDASIGRYKGEGGDEQKLLRNVQQTFRMGDLILGDAFFGTCFLLASLHERKIDAVFEQHGARKRVTEFRKGRRIGTRDHLIVLSKPKVKPDWMSEKAYDEVPEEITIRELKAGKKTIITTMLTSAQAEKHELKSLYKQRRHVELDLRNIKTTLGVEKLSCKTPEMNQKEIWVYFLVYNLIRIVMAQAAFLAEMLPRQLSFKHSLQLWNAWGQRVCGEMCPDNEYVLFELMAKKRVGNRPNRNEPRTVKQRPKALPLLMIPRRDAQAEIRKNGHPKKAK